MTFIDFFAGIGGFRKGMEMAGHKCVGFCEFDKYAVASYTSMHLLTDAQRWKLFGLSLRDRQKEILKDEYRNGEWYQKDVRSVCGGGLPDADCWCFGFPCQDISVAGKQKGVREGTRSGLFFEVMRILQETEEKSKPQYLFIENVKNLLSINKGWDFARVLNSLDENGYDAEWQVLNSKDWGVPQNRERVFIIGHLRRAPWSKVFPIEGTDSENSVDLIAHRKSYRRNTQVFNSEGITETLDTGGGGGRQFYTAAPIKIMGDLPYASGRITQRTTIYDASGAIGAQLATQYKDPQKIAIPVLTPDRANKRQNGRRFKEDGEPAFTLTAEDRHGVAVDIPCVRVNEAVKKGYAEAEIGKDSINFERPSSTTRRGRVDKGVANTLSMECHQGVFVKMPDGNSVYAVYYPKGDCYVAIRKLTPKECFRLQGWTDDYYEKAEFVNSASQLYKQAGNGVTVNVIYEIAKKMV